MMKPIVSSYCTIYEALLTGVTAHAHFWYDRGEKFVGSHGEHLRAQRIQFDEKMKAHCLLIWLAACVMVTRNQDVNFSIHNISCARGPSQGIRCDRGAHDNGAGVLQVSTPIDPGVEEVFYQTPVQMRDNQTGRAASFSSSFTFQIVTQPNLSAGDGMAFVMFSDPAFRGGSGGELGAYLPNSTEGTKTFCVEYDTWYNAALLDPDDNHIGIDLASVVSEETQVASNAGINLKGGYRIKAWIDYDFTTFTLEVRIANASQMKPCSPFMAYSLNLFDVVDDFMSVGFTAATGASSESHELFDWTFSSFGLSPGYDTPSSYSLGSPCDSLSPNGPPVVNDSRPTAGGKKSGIPVNMILRFVFEGAAAAAVVTIVFACFFVCLVRKLLRRGPYDDDANSSKSQHELPSIDMPTQFTYRQLQQATDDFSDESKLGQGGSGSVYRGQIAGTGALVAVKKVANRQGRAEKEFLDEVTAVSRLRHKNLVQLTGFCIDHEGGNYLLVYELMQHGSLDNLLHFDDDEGTRGALPWETRFAIVKEVAAGLAYAHKGIAKQVIHRDVKSSNVMIDENLTAKLGDFGLARLIEHSNNNPKTAFTQWAGTIGYLAPEVITGKCSDKWDVYGFGALVLEIASGRRPIDRSRPQEEWLLIDWVQDCHTKGDIISVADPRLLGNFSTEEITKVLLLGLLCTYSNPDVRPSMRKVELILAGYVPLPEIPAKEGPLLLESLNLSSGSEGSFSSSTSPKLQ